MIGRKLIFASGCDRVGRGVHVRGLVGMGGMGVRVFFFSVGIGEGEGVSDGEEMTRDDERGEGR